jgi:signal transduction histidine kinase
VLESGAKEVPEMRDRFLDHIARECSRLIRVARGLLVLARSQSQEEPPRPEFVELRRLLDDVLDTRPHGVAVNVECPDELAVFVDRDLVEIALSNLVANAIRHSTDGGVSIAVDQTPSRRVSIVITDSGGGIDDEEVARLQRRFATGEGRDGGGFGLGISIAAQAIETVGGVLEYGAQNGSTSVRVELPPASR